MSGATAHRTQVGQLPGHGRSVLSADGPDGFGVSTTVGQVRMGKEIVILYRLNLVEIRFTSTKQTPTLSKLI